MGKRESSVSLLKSERSVKSPENITKQFSLARCLEEPKRSIDRDQLAKDSVHRNDEKPTLGKGPQFTSEDKPSKPQPSIGNLLCASYKYINHLDKTFESYQKIAMESRYEEEMKEKEMAKFCVSRHKPVQQVRETNPDSH